MPDKPLGKAIVLCSRTKQDPATGMYSLIDCYNTLQVPSLPSDQQINVYVAVSGSVGRFNIDVRLSSGGSASSHVIGNHPCDLKGLDHTCDFVVTAGLRFTKEGVYTFEAYCGDKMLLSKTLEVVVSRN